MEQEREKGEMLSIKILNEASSPDPAQPPRLNEDTLKSHTQIHTDYGQTRTCILSSDADCKDSNKLYSNKVFQ